MDVSYLGSWGVAHSRTVDEEVAYGLITSLRRGFDGVRRPEWQIEQSLFNPEAEDV